MRFMQIESVLQTKNRSEPAKNRFSVALHFKCYVLCGHMISVASLKMSQLIRFWYLSHR